MLEIVTILWPKLNKLATKPNPKLEKTDDTRIQCVFEQYLHNHLKFRDANTNFVRSHKIFTK